MLIPKLNPSSRDREYKQWNFDQVSGIVRTWLFHDNIGHREMDRDILDLDHHYTKGFQSMGVLHYLGLKKEFKGIFSNCDLNYSIDQLRNDEQDFSFIIKLLENNFDAHDVSQDNIIRDNDKSIHQNSEGQNSHEIEDDISDEEIELGTLTLKHKKPNRKSKKKTKRSFKGRGQTNHLLKAKKDKQLGDLGEELVLRYEKMKLIDIGKTDLENAVENVSKTQGDGTGYDTKSFNSDGKDIYILNDYRYRYRFYRVR